VGVLGVVVAGALVFGACGGGGDEAFVPPKTGPAIYSTYCATCHGKQGQGFVGPSLVDVAAQYPDVADQVAVVAGGKGQMPAWTGRLTAKQIRTVVDYTRTAWAPAGPSAP